VGGLDGEGGDQQEVHLSGVHHLGHAGHALGEEGRIFQVTCKIICCDITEHPGLLAAAKDGVVGDCVVGGAVLLLHLGGRGALPFTSRTLSRGVFKC